MKPRHIVHPARANDAVRAGTVRFFIVAFAFSWTFWVVAYQTGILGEGLALIAGTWGPTAAAVILTALERERGALRSLLGRLVQWRAHWGWYVFSLAVTAVVVVVSLAVHRALGGTVDQANDPAQWYLVFPGFAQVFFFSVLGEELGWRGYALPRLQARYGPLRASLIIGVVWWAWHLPLWFMAGNFHSQIPFLLFALNSIPMSIVLTWVFNRTGGSVLVPSVLHAASNLTIGVAPILPEYTGGSLTPLVLAMGLLSGLALAISVRWARGGDRPIVL